MHDTDYRLILQAYDYLIDYGYLPETEEGNSVDYTQVLPSAVDHFQRMARLPRTGKWIIYKIFFFILDPSGNQNFGMQTFALKFVSIYL